MAVLVSAAGVISQTAPESADPLPGPGHLSELTRNSRWPLHSMQFHATGSVLTGGIIMGSNATVNGPLALLRLPGCVHLAKKDAEHGQYEEGIYSAETHTP